MNTENDIALLISEREIAMDLEIPYKWYEKAPGWDKLEPGDKIKIEWKGRELNDVEDEGYLFQLPMCDESLDMLDFFVHIPDPDNSSGIGPAPQVFTHFISLLQNKLVKRITKITHILK